MGTLADKIIRPILTEKSLDEARGGRYTFEVALEANKDQVRNALTEHFGVTVKSVKTAIQKDAQRIVPKSRRLVPGKKWKKAVVEITSGKMDMFEINGGTDDQKS